MSDAEENQILVPPSFVALFVPPGRIRPTESRETIAQRYEFCEDLAQMLVEQAQLKRFELGADESDVLERMALGLRDASSPLNAAEAWWVIRRLAELLEWPAPAGEQP